MKEMRDGCNKYGGPHPSLDCDDKPMGGPRNEEANYSSRGYRGGYQGNYYGRNSGDNIVSNKSKIEQIFAAFLTEEFSTILQNKLPPKLGDPRSFMIPFKLTNSVEYLALTDLDASINLMPYSLYTALSGTTLKPTRMSFRLANHTYQYPMGVAENIIVQVGKFVFHVDFVILQMEEDDRVPLILGRPFLHTADAIIRVKNKELNLGIGEDRSTFLIDKAMQHSHINDDT
ncbi:reverse transcriptase domain-containing protein [Tanacetum coccineum]